MGNEMTAEEARREHEELMQFLREEGISFHRSDRPGMIMMRIDRSKADAFDGRAR